MSIRVAALAAPDTGLPEAAAEQPKGLPEGAVLLVDGTVLFTPAHPDAAVLRTQRGGEAVTEERFDTIRFHRLTGKDLRESLKAAEGDETLVLFCGSTKLGLLRGRALYDGMDAQDCIAVGRVIFFLAAAGAKTGT